ncbi:membrane-bound metal-dependent hydrolase, partial [mine drainage metagenome]
MLGRDHALLGGLGYLAVAPMILHSPTWPNLGVGCVTSAAFALLPDIDEPGSTVSRKLGPISRTVSHVTNAVAGGHRQATHSLLFAALVGIATWFALFSPTAIAIIVAASFLLVFRMLLPAILRHVPFIGLAGLLLTGGSAYWAYHLTAPLAGRVPP